MGTVIWRIHDGKSGHSNQTLGLVRSLSSSDDIIRIDLSAPARWKNWLWWIAGIFPPGNRLTKPDIIIGAGHATHLAILAARRAFGGKAIVLMKPSLPLRMFDLCVVPEHDAVSSAGNLIATRGALNIVEPSKVQQRSRGLMLIGGPSSAYGWNSAAMVGQIVNAVAGQPTVHWTLTTSRRTPGDFVALLSEQNLINLAIVPCEQTGPGWVPQELARSAQVWVSEDSVSMVYEALTSGAAVGLLAVPSKHAGRVARGVQSLVAGGWVTQLADWNGHDPLPSPPAQLHEAQRCASLICERFQLTRAA